MASPRRQPLTSAEISGQHAAELPRREALSLVFGSGTVPSGAIASAAAAAPVAAPEAEAEQIAEIVEESR